MAANPLIVHIQTATLGETMNEVRVWLDGAKIQLSGFKLKPTGIEIVFSSESDAERFRERFVGQPA
jgi:hypothetical protein